MCLGVPGKILEWLDRDPIFGRALVEFAGIRRECHMACVSDAQVGDYVVVHAGMAISRIDEVEALQSLQDWRVIAEIEQENGSEEEQSQ